MNDFHHPVTGAPFSEPDVRLSIRTGLSMSVDAKLGLVSQ